MKKIEYQAPEMEIFEMKVQNPLLDVSTGESTGGGANLVDGSTEAD